MRLGGPRKKSSERTVWAGAAVLYLRLSGGGDKKLGRERHCLGLIRDHWIDFLLRLFSQDGHYPQPEGENPVYFCLFLWTLSDTRI